ncbi:leucine-rich repeat-containing protein 14-like [Sarcophilus harrisii]|uniref:Leucine-rich repeat-containing protein 14 n=1 Tax=Sarcophilus harrisii TaxID=9305 RepID=G3VWF7_SARHA|nr:leucine-rich repeat-containing protein 14-like [Sarcophilus harrisii]XP_031806415.1 leucine-rich repeat-containing protein 14-like [Sarcophilus harrisii]
MYSLTFLSAQQLVQDEEAMCKILESMPRSMFNILFKMAFRKNKTQLLCELVKMWPYSEFKLQLQLQTCRHCSWTYKKCPECRRILTYDELGKNKIDAIILGVMKYIRKVIMDGSQEPPHRRLQLLDMTGLLDKGFSWNLKLTRLWVSSIRQARVYSSGPQSQSSTEGAEASSVTFPAEASVNLLVDLVLCPPTADMLKELLQENANGPLHLKCRDFYITFMVFRDVLKFLPILDPLELRRIDISHCFMTSELIVSLLSHFTTFPNFQSFKLTFNINKVSNLVPMLNTETELLAAELRKLRWLKEIALPSMCLSDQLENLLGGLQYSLESLQLSFCSLTKKDLTYLARSHHSTHLIKLDLSGNDIIQQLDIFLELLKSTSKSLKWLNMTLCEIKDSDFYATLPYLSSCTKLSHLGLSDNPLSSKSIFTFLGSPYHKLSNLKLMSLPIFLDCCQNLPQSLPRSLESYVNAEMTSHVINKIKQMLIGRRNSDIVFTPRFTFDVGDYFDL